MLAIRFVLNPQPGFPLAKSSSVWDLGASVSTVAISRQTFILRPLLFFLMATIGEGGRRGV